MEESKSVKIAPEWELLLQEEFTKPYFLVLRGKVRTAYLSSKVHPHPSRMLRAFAMCAPKDVRVVILGQDPYHTPGVADGLAFSSFPTNPVPPSLLNIYKEIGAEFGVAPPPTPDLTERAKQGVLLLNASLTVRSGIANSHAEYGWHEFTDAVIRILSHDCEHVVFMLWGNYARQKRTFVDVTKHLILESPHPSPLSAHKGFFGNNHFKKANEYLSEHGEKAIDWLQDLI